MEIHFGRAGIVPHGQQAVAVEVGPEAEAVGRAAAHQLEKTQARHPFELRGRRAHLGQRPAPVAGLEGENGERGEGHAEVIDPERSRRVSGNKKRPESLPAFQT